MRRFAATFGTALVALVATHPTAPHAEPLRRLEGDARTLASASFATPGAPGAYFLLESAGPDLDLRSDPGSLVLTTAAGRLAAQPDAPARRFRAFHFDTISGRPLRLDASPGAHCATGAEPPCWHAGDPVPYSDEVAAALGAAALQYLPLSSNTQIFALICASSIGFSGLPPGECGTRISPPLAPLNTDPIDSNPRKPLLSNVSVLREDEQALLGCGPFWGTDCAVDGIDLRNAEASVLLQSFHTQDSQGAPLVRGTPSGVLGVPTNSFQSEMAALSFNMQTVLVALSVPDGGVPEGESDPTVLLPSDPFSTAPRQCSFAQPQYCASVSRLFALTAAADPLDGDPDGAARRWVWTAGAEYRVVEASGNLADYAGGRIHVLGVERSRTQAATTGVPIALFPAANTTLAPDAPFAMPASNEATSTDFGIAYLTAPEPTGAALTGVAIAALILIARRSPSPPA